MFPHYWSHSSKPDHLLHKFNQSGKSPWNPWRLPSHLGKKSTLGPVQEFCVLKSWEGEKCLGLICFEAGYSLPFLAGERNLALKGLFIELTPLQQGQSSWVQNSPPLSAVVLRSFATCAAGMHFMPEQSHTARASATHSSMLSVKVREKECLFRFLHALACLFKDLSKKQGVLSLWHKDTLILQLALKRNSSCFRELLWLWSKAGVWGLAGLSFAKAILRPNCLD